VKSAKHLLIRTVSTADLTYEELETVIIDILNSRPLTPISYSPRDLSALTPGHFLIGGPITASPDIHNKEVRSGLVIRWKHVDKVRQDFWNRWSHEYLQELQNRSNGQFAAVAVATRENSDGTRRKGRCNPSRQHLDFSRRMHESDSSAGGVTTRHSKGNRRQMVKAKSVRRSPRLCSNS